MWSSGNRKEDGIHVEAKVFLGENQRLDYIWRIFTAKLVFESKVEVRDRSVGGGILAIWGVTLLGKRWRRLDFIGELTVTLVYRIHV